MIRHILYAFCSWSDKTALGEGIRNSVWLFPAVEIFHLLGLGDSRRHHAPVEHAPLGVPILREEPLPNLARDLWKMMVGALAVMLVSGYALFSSEALKDFFNWGFRLKMASLFLAIIFTFTIQRKIILADDGSVSPLLRKLTAIVSLLLWLTVGLGGRSIGHHRLPHSRRVTHISGSVLGGRRIAAMCLAFCQGIPSAFAESL